MEIKGNKIHSHFISKEYDDENIIDTTLTSEDWEFLNDHARFSRHSIQISKCFDSDCDHCSSHPLRSQIFKLLGSRFVPPPYAITRNEDGLYTLSLMYKH